MSLVNLFLSGLFILTGAAAAMVSAAPQGSSALDRHVGAYQYSGTTGVACGA